MTEFAGKSKTALWPITRDFVKEEREATISSQGVEMRDDWFIRRLNDEDYCDYLQIDSRNDGGKEKIINYNGWGKEWKEIKANHKADTPLHKKFYDLVRLFLLKKPKHNIFTSPLDMIHRMSTDANLVTMSRTNLFSAELVPNSLMVHDLIKAGLKPQRKICGRSHEGS